MAIAVDSEGGLSAQRDRIERMFDSVEQVQTSDPFTLAAALALLTQDDLLALDDRRAEAVVAATQRVINAVSARQSMAIETHARRYEESAERWREEVAADGRRRVPHTSGSQMSASVLAPLLRVAPRTASTRVRHAQVLVTALPGVHDLAWEGDLEPYRVTAVVRESDAVPTGRLHEFEARLLRRDITAVACSRLRAAARRAAERVDPNQARQAADLAAARRSVRVGPGHVPGMSTWTVHLPTATSARVLSAVDALAAEYARANPGQPIETARADALVDLVEASATITTTIELVAPVIFTRRPPHGGGAPADSSHGHATAHGPQPDEEGERGEEHVLDGTVRWDGPDLWFVPSPVEVPGAGSLLPADLVALLGSPDTAIRLARSDLVTGAVRGQDPTTYRPGAATARAVRSRDGTCRFPGCATPARRTQLDHVIAYPAGPTTPPNLLCLCATHHGFKHHANWTLAMTPEGVATWTAPDGRTHTTWPLDRHGTAAAA